MINIEKLLYTYKHRHIVLYLAEKYLDNKKLLDQLQKHDLDKMFLMLFYDKKDIEEYHQKMASHHDNNKEKTELDYIEMVLDWESARYTKPDKPLNAYDTLIRFYPHLTEPILPILKKLNIDKSGLPMEEDVLSYAKSLDSSNLEDVKKELIDYISHLDDKIITLKR